MSEHDGHARFASYYIAHYRWLVLLVSRAIPSPFDVEDLCAEVFAAALEKRVDVGGYALGQQRKWLYEAASKAMMRRSRTWARYQEALERAFDQSAAEWEDPLDVVLQREASLERDQWDAQVRAVVKLLRTEHRHVLELTAAGLTRARGGRRGREDGSRRTSRCQRAASRTAPASMHTARGVGEAHSRSRRTRARSHQFSYRPRRRVAERRNRRNACTAGPLPAFRLVNSTIAAGKYWS